MHEVAKSPRKPNRMGSLDYIFICIKTDSSGDERPAPDSIALA